MKNVSDYLKRERELRDISLESIAKDTCIPLKIIKSLDEGDEDSLPQDIFVKGYIKNFCKSLGLDDTEALLQFDIYLKEKKDGLKPSQSQDNNNNRDDFLTKEPSFFNKKNTVFLLFLASLVVLIVYSIRPDVTLRTEKTVEKEKEVKETLLMEATDAEKNTMTEPLERDVPEDVGQDKASVDAKAIDTKDKALEEAEEDESKQKVKSNSLHVLKIKASDLTWIKVILDNETEKEVMLREGEVATFNAYKEFFMELGNAGGVIVTLDGEEVKAVGEIGQVRHIRYNFEEEKDDVKNNDEINNVAHEAYKMQ